MFLIMCYIMDYQDVMVCMQGRNAIFIVTDDAAKPNTDVPTVCVSVRTTPTQARTSVTKIVSTLRTLTMYFLLPCFFICRENGVFRRVQYIPNKASPSQYFSRFQHRFCQMSQIKKDQNPVFQLIE